MKENIKQAVRQVLKDYLERNNMRKTAERFAVLDAVYSFNGHFSLDDLNQRLQETNFPVSRATLYNTINLFIQMRLVIYQRTLNKTLFEACYQEKNHSHQICTMCGKITEVKSSLIDAAVEQTQLRRFRKDGYSLYIYGTCSSCQAKITRKAKSVSKAKETNRKKKQVE